MSSIHRWFRLAPAALVGLALGWLGATALAEPPDAAAERSVAAPAPSPPAAGYAPDPEGRPSTKQWVFEVTYEKGNASITSARAVTLDTPSATARVMGRFAIELYVGQELLDRLRFNVPLTGDALERLPRRMRRIPVFDEGVLSRLRVQMADNPRASYAKLIDRMTGAEQRFRWPPEPDGKLLPVEAPLAAATKRGGAAARPIPTERAAKAESRPAPAERATPPAAVSAAPQDAASAAPQDKDGAPTTKSKKPAIAPNRK